MSNAYPEERSVVQFRTTLPVVFSFIITMLICYLLGQAPTPYYLSQTQSIRIDAMAQTSAASDVASQQQK